VGYSSFRLGTPLEHRWLAFEGPKNRKGLADQIVFADPIIGSVPPMGNRVPARICEMPGDSYTSLIGAMADEIKLR
jgi:hypothetical protein